VVVVVVVVMMVVMMLVMVMVMVFFYITTMWQGTSVGAVQYVECTGQRDGGDARAPGPGTQIQAGEVR
jgi:hypothetical protein